jgi:hypothetical protein
VGWEAQIYLQVGTRANFDISLQRSEMLEDAALRKNQRCFSKREDAIAKDISPRHIIHCA